MLCIGALEIRMSPSKGWSSSRIRKIAPATESAETTSERLAMVHERLVELREARAALNVPDDLITTAVQIQIGSVEFPGNRPNSYPVLNAIAGVVYFETVPAFLLRSAVMVKIAKEEARLAIELVELAKALAAESW